MPFFFIVTGFWLLAGAVGLRWSTMVSDGFSIDACSSSELSVIMLVALIMVLLTRDRL